MTKECNSCWFFQPFPFTVGKCRIGKKEGEDLPSIVDMRVKGRCGPDARYFLSCDKGDKYMRKGYVRKVKG